MVRSPGIRGYIREVSSWFYFFVFKQKL